ncbi:SUF system Fe-S cluster assembly regulator [Rhodospirillum rubrum]|uniref:Transcriptional regulator, BadM/Rrf2 family n=1 Tax=Rhodospirillum rubrum (strain ATCC 11170 / ATH 1.1.1 / DSM 467 / LMG 4362 / NCIMB 8255 / S1) TaxID=269796 RepID=Q2RR74_RHORT|nr:SUF system Fe-S cluster assembly regulator [Rhodospirillum rubrum]ABC23371.1 transcriptional regulator, BadM/Rrf2 family [Rhodospirillum rubrum ATCC 11170]AEO49106.1 BadM/Rrf2 family transcriptional regulator [Rhodospirillum rubrum F11]MBK1665755.1 SUF system Fe-S cluster assembly regulator [Rhodospirillum rubrum]MBK1677838.1 SUF system Fe-S cluster assembly regulator [Rhodospirillum rubrum]MBK5955016.1 SUF system Fe-S cluster assembly regulator [Rhodospirillum rubrum]
MFRINKLTDYAVVLLVDMARTDKVRAAQQIACDTGVPLPTVAKVMKALVRGNLVISQRGATGGYGLARPACEITVADMIQALEGPVALTACVETTDDACGLETLCPMHGHWNRVNKRVEEALRTVSLAEMASGPIEAFGLPLAERRAALARSLS